MLERSPRPVPDALDRRRARAISHPTAARILEAVSDAGGPVTVTEVAERLAVHPNTVRQHLQRLRDAELVVEETEAPGGHRGRPRLLYHPVPEALDAPPRTNPYEWLAVVLLEGQRSGEDLRQIARAHGQAEVANDAAGGVQAIARLAADHGFHPRQEQHGDGLELVLERCPIAAAAGQDPGTVCRVHLGLLEGAAEAVGGVQVQGIADADPRAAGCRVRLRIVDD
jgi:predicted ArsR family transcriptional regulator